MRADRSPAQTELVVVLVAFVYASVGIGRSSDAGTRSRSSSSLSRFMRLPPGARMVPACRPPSSSKPSRCANLGVSRLRIYDRLLHLA